MGWLLTGQNLLVRIFGHSRVVLSEFVRVMLHQASADLERQDAQVSVLSGNLDDSAEGFETVGGNVLCPDVQAVMAGGDIVQDNAAVVRRNSVVGSTQRNDDRTHFGMNVAEDVGDALAVEEHRALRMRLVESEVEALAVEEGEDVVKEGVEVGKLNVTAGGYDENVRGELLILLSEGELPLSGDRREHGLLRGCKPSDDIGGGRLRNGVLALLASEMNVESDLGTLRPSGRGKGQGAQGTYNAEDG